MPRTEREPESQKCARTQTELNPTPERTQTKLNPTPSRTQTELNPTPERTEQNPNPNVMVLTRFFHRYIHTFHSKRDILLYLG